MGNRTRYVYWVSREVSIKIFAKSSKLEKDSYIWKEIIIRGNEYDVTLSGKQNEEKQTIVSSLRISDFQSEKYDGSSYLETAYNEFEKLYNMMITKYNDPSFSYLKIGKQYFDLPVLEDYKLDSNVLQTLPEEFTLTAIWNNIELELRVYNNDIIGASASLNLEVSNELIPFTNDIYKEGSYTDDLLGIQSF